MTNSSSNGKTLTNTNINPAACLSYFWNLILAFLLLIILSPVLLATYLLLLKQSVRKPLFRQTRVGKDGALFTIYKFKTMVEDATKDGPFICENYTDPRITALGKILRKSKLDELPQLFNIIKGDMNFVGPRPEIPFFHEKNLMTIPNWQQRLKVKPGITGLAQIHPTVSHNPAEKIVLDLEYIAKRSFIFDLKIIYRTALSLLS